MNVQQSEMDSMMKSSDPSKKKLICKTIWDIKLRGITVNNGNPDDSGYLEAEQPLEFLKLKQIPNKPKHPTESLRTNEKKKIHQSTKMTNKRKKKRKKNF